MLACEEAEPELLLNAVSVTDIASALLEDLLSLLGRFVISFESSEAAAFRIASSDIPSSSGELERNLSIGSC
jgi:hypothetical protein